MFAIVISVLKLYWLYILSPDSVVCVHIVYEFWYLLYKWNTQKKWMFGNSDLIYSYKYM